MSDINTLAIMYDYRSDTIATLDQNANYVETLDMNGRVWNTLRECPVKIHEPGDAVWICNTCGKRFATGEQHHKITGHMGIWIVGRL